MPARTVSVKLDAAVQGYLAGIGKAQLATQRFADQASKGITKHEKSINQLSNKAGIFGAALGAGLGLAVKASADFEQSMSNVAATGQDARNSLAGLRDTALAAGKATKFSATEAAGGIEALAKAGVSAKDIMGGGLTGALDLAATGNLDVADSAEVAAIAMSQFNLKGKDVPHVADLIAAGAGKAQGEVSDMAAALKQSGLVASQFGLSLEENVGTLSAFANAGLIGSDAGTSFKTMLLQLASPSDKAAGLMEDLSIQAYDVQGNFVGAASLAEQLKDKLGPLSQAERDAALATIFGSDAIRAANVLYKEGGQGITDWTNKVDDSGFAARAAAIKMDNLKGDVEKLFGSLETAAVGLGAGGQGPLRGLVQGATEAVSAFDRLDDSSKSALLVIGGGIAVLALSAAGVGKLAIAANEAKIAFRGLGITAKGASIAVAGVGAALGVAAFAFGILAEKSAKNTQAVDDYVTALNSETDAIKGNVEAVAAKNLQDAKAFDNAQMIGLSIRDVTEAALGNEDAMRRVNTTLDEYIQAGVDSADVDVNLRAQAAIELSDALGIENGRMEDGKKKAGQMAEATGDATFQQKQLTSASADAEKQIKDLTAAMFENARAALKLSGAEIGYEAAVDDATKSAKENGKTLDIHTKKGRANKTALDNLATSSNAYREELIGQGASTKKVDKATEDARKTFIKTAEKMGLSTKEAKKLADKYGLVDQKINDLNSKKVGITFSTNAPEVAAKYGVTLQGSSKSSARRSRGDGPPAHIGSNLDSIIGAPAQFPKGHPATGGPSLVNISNPERGARAQSVPPAMSRVGDDVALGVGRHLGSAIQKRMEALMMGPSGSVGAYSAGMAGTIARLRAAGARSFTTYPGHHPSMAKARDVTPHNWNIANTARASKGVWYVIYQMKIASKNHGNVWRQYHPNNRRGDWQHRRHIHVGWYGQGTSNARPGPAIVGENGPELINMRGGEQVRPIANANYSYASSGASGGGWGGTTVVHQHYHFDRYIGNRDELIRDLVAAKRQGRLDVILR